MVAKVVYAREARIQALYKRHTIIIKLFLPMYVCFGCGMEILATSKLSEIPTRARVWY